MGALASLKTVIPAPVAINGTLTVSYPAGASQATLTGYTGNQILIGEEVYKEDAGQFSIVFGASSIVLTNTSGMVWPALRATLTLGQVARRGSYETQLGSTAGTAQPAVGGSAGGQLVTIGGVTQTVADALGILSTPGADIRLLGLIGDGLSHPLSEKFATLSAAQAIYPRAASLTEQIDGHAIQLSVDRAVAAGKDCVVILPFGVIALTSFPIDSTATKSCTVIGYRAVIKAVGTSQGAWRHGQISNRATGYFCWRGVDTDSSSSASTVGVEVFFGVAGVGKARCLEMRDARHIRFTKGLRLGNCPRGINLDNIIVYGADFALQPGAGVEVINTVDSGYGSFTWHLTGILVANYTWGFDFLADNTIEGVKLDRCQAYNGWGFLRVRDTKAGHRSLMWSVTDCDWQGKGFAIELQNVELITVKGGFWIMDVNSDAWPFPENIATTAGEYRIFNFSNVKNFEVSDTMLVAAGPGGEDVRPADFVMGNFDILCTRGAILNNTIKADHATAICGFRLSGTAEKTIYEAGTQKDTWWGEPPVVAYGGGGFNSKQLSAYETYTKGGAVTREGLYEFAGSLTATSDATTGEIVISLPTRGGLSYFNASPFVSVVMLHSGGPNQYVKIKSKTTTSITVVLLNPAGTAATNATVALEWTATGK